MKTQFDRLSPRGGLAPSGGGDTGQREKIVSIVIVSWNAKKYLLECLESLSQAVCSYPMEVIVVDNASDDGSPELVDSGFPQVRLIRNSENLGFAKANNIGIAESHGNYVALVNSDVHVLPGCITRLVEYLETHANVGMVGPRIQGGTGELQRSCRGFPSVWNMLCRALMLDAAFSRIRWCNGYLMRYWHHDDCRSVDILSGCFWLVRRRALNEVGLLDEGFFMYGEDMDWCKRFRKAGWRVVFNPDAEAIHYGGGSSANAPIRFFVEKQRADLRYWQKHHGNLAVGAYLLTSLMHHMLRCLGNAGALILRIGDGDSRRYKIRRSAACLRWIVGHRLVTSNPERRRGVGDSGAKTA